MIDPWAPGKRTRKLKLAEPPTETQHAAARSYALAICRGAATEAARRLADQLAQRWTGCDCAQLANSDTGTHREKHRTDERR